MKASLVAYDFRKVHKKSKVCQRQPKIASDPNVVASNFRG
jgi:hypothetical protein